MNIPDIAKQLHIPLDACIVVSSGTLHVLGIRNARDIDVVVTKDVFEGLVTDTRFTQVPQPWGGYNLAITIDDTEVEILAKLEWEAFPTTVDMAISEALVVDGVNFMNLNQVKGFKRALGREKDFVDIDLIEKWERTHSV